MTLALVLAAALNAQPAPTPCIPDLQAKPAGADQPGPCRPTKPVLMAVRDAARLPPPPTERTPNLFRQPSRCGPLGAEVTRWIEASTGRSGMVAQYAVIRSVDGCGVPTPVGYHPDYLVPVEPETLERITPEDAPPRKR